MAFIELTEDELSLMDESEREQYNKELELARERAAFVERLVQLENADFHYEKPRLERIKPVRRVDVPKYAVPDKVRAKLPDSIDKVREMTGRGKENTLLSQRIREGIPENVRIANIPDVTVSSPDIGEGYSGIGIYEINSVEGAKIRIDAPELNVQPVGRSVISGLPETVKALAPQVAFEFERDTVDVVPVKAVLPEIKEYTGPDAVRISNIPELAVNAAPEAEFEYSYDTGEAMLEIEKITGDIHKAPEVAFSFSLSNESAMREVGRIAADVHKAPEVSFSFSRDSESAMLDIRDIVGGAVKEPPKVSFEMEPVAVGRITKPEIEPIDISDISERIEKLGDGAIAPVSIQAEKPSLPDITGYEEPDIELSIPQAEKITLPEAGEYTAPAIDRVGSIEMPDVNVPEYSIRDYDFRGISELPKVSAASPCCTENEINDVMKRIISSI